MNPKTLLLRGRDCALVCLAAGLISCSANPRTAPAKRGPSPAYQAMTKASSLFELGRETRRSRATSSARTSTSGSRSKPSGPRTDPALDRPRAPRLLVSALRERPSLRGARGSRRGSRNVRRAGRLRARAKSRIRTQRRRRSFTRKKTSTTDFRSTCKYDVPITINDAVLKILAAFQSDLHGVIHPWSRTLRQVHAHDPPGVRGRGDPERPGAHRAHRVVVPAARHGRARARTVSGSSCRARAGSTA